MLAPSLWGDDPKDKLQNPTDHSRIYLVKLKGSINPGAAELLKRALREADMGLATCLVIELDTPGGLVSTLRDMVQEVMASPIPTVVYVHRPHLPVLFSLLPPMLPPWRPVPISGRLTR
ncbi:MAG: hypothetical protein JRF43_08840 [Deltaproteobacteria bacterium]|nr:hypothetical protein [Deltaproteobacteria bacterium]